MADSAPLILVVDDDDLLRTSICGVLESNGFRVVSAREGQSGLEVALSKKPALILLDYQMPILDGVGMLIKLREEGEWGQKVPVILATNVYDINVINKVMELGVTEYILKSTTSLEEIATLVKSHVAPQE